MDIFTRVCEAFGQQISAEKSKLLVVEGIHWRPPRQKEEEVMESQGINPPTEDDAPMPRPSITVNGIELEVADFFSYLGSIESGGATMDAEADHRCKQMRATFYRDYRQMYGRRTISTRGRLRLFIAKVAAVGLYACQAWNFRAKRV